MKNAKMWRAGGTCVTNFTDERLPIYKEAIYRYKRDGGPTHLWIGNSTQPDSSNQGLHCNLPSGQDLSDFWKVYDEMYEQYEAGDWTLLKRHEPPKTETRVKEMIPLIQQLLDDGYRPKSRGFYGGKRKVNFAYDTFPLCGKVPNKNDMKWLQDEWLEEVEI